MPPTTSPAHPTEWSPPLIAPGISDRNLSNAVLAGKVTNIMTGGARPKVKRMKKQTCTASDALAEATPDVNHQQLIHEKARLLDHRDRILKSHEREATDQMHQIAALKFIAVKYENNIATLNDEPRLFKLANQSNDIPPPPPTLVDALIVVISVNMGDRIRYRGIVWMISLAATKTTTDDVNTCQHVLTVTCLRTHRGVSTTLILA